MLSRRGALSARAKLNGSRRGPSPDDAHQPKPPPFLARPFEGGMTGWIVVFGAGLFALISAAVTSRMSIAISLPVLVTPIVIVYGFAVAQWWQVGASGAERANWWHLSGVVAALILWSLFPTVPNGLSSASAPAACSALPIPSSSLPDCLHRAALAFDYHAIAWWSAAGLIVAGALLARRSRIAAWAGIPTAIAGCALAASFLQQILNHFGIS